MLSFRVNVSRFVLLSAIIVFLVALCTYGSYAYVEPIWLNRASVDAMLPSIV